MKIKLKSHNNGSKMPESEEHLKRLMKFMKLGEEVLRDLKEDLKHSTDLEEIRTLNEYIKNMEEDQRENQKIMHERLTSKL